LKAGQEVLVPNRRVNLRLVFINAAFLVTVPGIVGAGLPLLLVHLSGDSTHVSLGALRYAGMGIMLGAAVVYTRCAIELGGRGQGVPAPIEPTRFMVRSGLYRYVRNPMYLSGSLFLYGQAVALEQGVLFAYAVAVSVLQHLGVVLLEEPALRKRFGESYRRYCQDVPRWLPRIHRAPQKEG
jgi:protein-S-isoprenylcysteine O-methyltransferase Ste14